VIVADARGMPSPWIVQWAGLVPRDAEVLDVAAGKGRHAGYFAGLEHEVTVIDRDISAFAGFPTLDIGIMPIRADLEDGSPWPLPGRTFGGVIVTNYLHRPLFPILLDSVERGGVLLYETFMEGNERFGRPSNPAFLLKDGELLELVRGRFSVVAYEARLVSEPKMAMVQRIAARKL
jgi:SAM-dependent methyltransferase